jgi:hypothetical protein
MTKQYLPCAPQAKGEFKPQAIMKMAQRASVKSFAEMTGLKTSECKAALKKLIWIKREPLPYTAQVIIVPAALAVSLLHLGSFKSRTPKHEPEVLDPFCETGIFRGIW